MDIKNHIELYHGFIAGIGQSIISHPIDTYKTWIQIQYKEKVTLKNLYRGFTYPTLFNSIISGLAFKTYEYGKETSCKYNKLLGGIYAGITTGLLSSFIEYKKIKAQLIINTKFNPHCLITMQLREIPACVCYYPIYEILKNNNFNTLLAGGIAGVTCWTSSYWADVMNTYVMTGLSIKQVIQKLYFMDYFRGILICIPRAFIINAVGYYCYELSKEFYQSKL
jgi:solute carrier family 25 carnitine/acylcarnitine transporter 20/29